MRIDEALSGLKDNGLPVPCCHTPYLGDAEVYVTFQLLPQRATLYAEGREAETSVQYAVSIFRPRYSAALLREVKRLLEQAGYIATVEAEFYDRDTRRNQTTIIATIEGDAYG